jgi:centromere protein V
MHDAAMSSTRTFQGGCHCGAVRFEVDVAAEPEVSLCNCSICDMTGFLHVIVPRERFRLTSGRDTLSSYRFNTGVAEHLFCSVCGIKSFYVPRSHPDGYSVNARCLDGNPLAEVVPRPFDGQNWEKSAPELTGR